MTAIAITAYPLSREFRTRLQDAIGEPLTYLTLPELRRLPPSQMVRELRRRPGLQLCVVAVEDAGSYALLPILETIAALTNARTIEVVRNDLIRAPISRRTALAHAARVLAATADGHRVLALSRLELDRLLAAPAQRAPFGETDDVLFANGNLWFGVRAGGSVAHVAGVVNGLVRSGLSVTFAAPTEPMLLDQSVSYRRLETPAAFGLPTEVNHYRFGRAMARQLAAEAAPSFVYQRLSVANYAGVVVGRSRRRPLVLEYNGSEVWAAEHWGSPLRYAALARRAEEACLRHAQLVVTVSRVLADEVEGRGVPRERIVWYPNCVDPAAFDPGRFDDGERKRLRASLGIPDDALVASFLGTFGHWHGVDVLARAIRRLAVDDPDWLRRKRVRFLLIGDGVRMREVLQELGREGQEFTSLPGLVPQAEAPRYLAASDILLSPHVPNPDGTPFFGSPTKLFEYMATGLPIVASALDQIGDVLAPGVPAGADLPADPPPDDPHVGVLTTPGDAAELAAALRLLVERPRWRAHLGRRARARVLERYTWDHHVAAILDAKERVRLLDR